MRSGVNLLSLRPSSPHIQDLITLMPTQTICFAQYVNDVLPFAPLDAREIAGECRGAVSAIVGFGLVGSECQADLESNHRSSDKSGGWRADGGKVSCVHP